MAQNDLEITSPNCRRQRASEYPKAIAFQADSGKSSPVYIAFKGGPADRHLWFLNTDRFFYMKK